MQIITDSIIAFLLELIGSLIVDEVKHLWEVKENIRRLRIKLRYLQSFLSDVDGKQLPEMCSNELLLTHINEIRRLTLEIENVVNSYKVICDRGNRLKKSVCWPCTLVHIHRVGVKIDRIERRVQEAIGIMNDLGNVGNFSEEEQSSSIRSKL